MPTIITHSEVKIFSDIELTQQVGNTIVNNNASTDITVDYTTLGAYLSAGTNYWAVARTTDDDSHTSEWSEKYSFITLIDAEIEGITVSGNTADIESTASYQDVTVATIGYRYSTSEYGTNPVTVVCPDEQAWEQYSLILPQENTRYYIVAFVIDNLGREWQTPWSSAESVVTGYTLPVITIAPTNITDRSVEGRIDVTSLATITSLTVTLSPYAGRSFTKTLTPQSGTTAFTITNGEVIDNDRVVINPSTNYILTASAINAAGTSNASVRITTRSPQFSAIDIDDITNISTDSARVNISFS